MYHYQGNIGAVEKLVREMEVHRDVYVSSEIFELEMEHLFPNTWVYVGHASQIAKPGDFLTATVGRQPVLATRHTDGTVHVFHNRCPHKGTKIASEPCGNTGKFFRCPYHAWSFKTDGSFLSIPLKKGYDGVGFEQSQASEGLPKVGDFKVYRDFIFAKLNPGGPSFEEFFGESLSTIDNMIDRSPEGKLAIEAAPIRYMHTCNWKMLVENQTDTCHPMVAHESSAGTAVKVWEREGAGSKEKPMAVELYAPFTSPYEFYEKSGIRVWPNGHGHSGVHASVHADYSEIEGYFDQLVAAYGEERARLILGDVRHNSIYFPNLMVKGPVQIIRNFIPLAVDRTLVESWVFRLVGAPDTLYERALMYNRFINAPTSIVGHDDMEMYERAQEGLRAGGNEWVNLQRLYEPDEEPDTTAIINGTSERQMRNQYHAWKKYIVGSMEQAA